MLDAFFAAIFDPLIGSIDELIIAAHIGQFPRGMLIIQEFLQVDEFSKHFVF